MHALRLVLAALLAVLAACSAGTMDAEWHFHGSARRDVIDRPMVDPDTPRSAYNITNSAGTKQFNLMFSDEFNEDGRNFSSQAPQREPYWTAMDFYNPTTGDLEYYMSEAVSTEGGSMVITANNDPTTKPGWHYTSGMVQSWNQMCFTGGIIEARVLLPGDATTPGFWPAFWMMGNLGRAGLVDSTDGVRAACDCRGPWAPMWPWTYDTCNAAAQWQQVNKCEKSPGFGLNPEQGRGSPEIDILEARVSRDDSTAKSTATVAGTLHFTPKNPENVSYDSGWWSCQECNGYVNGDALHDYIGAEMEVDNEWWGQYHDYSVEWVPGEYIRWTVDGEFLLEITAEALKEQEANMWKVGPRLISEEPSYVMFNLALSNDWSPPSSHLKFPGTLQVDYVRIWQEEKAQQMSCSPPSHPTEQFIKTHLRRYIP